MGLLFENEPLTDFSISENRKAFTCALEEVQKAISQNAYSACPIIDGVEVHTQEVVDSNDPSDPDVTLGKVHYAGEADGEAALISVSRGMSSWKKTPVESRVEILFKAADEMRTRRLELAALLVREAGKPWKEADADVAEAIDFCQYYALEMRRLAVTQRTAEVLGETNDYLYQPRGVAVVIAPWNFPLAIPCGMAVAALVTGNTVILKPAEQTSLIGAALAEILLRAGIPGSAFAFLPGRGEVVGEQLVVSRHVDLICFTGSRPVGLNIIEKAAVVREGQRNVKRVICEMGGKNAIIVDEDADPDEAVKGVLYSAFGYSGQKCSACSRVIVVDSAYEPFMKRLTGAAADVATGRARESFTVIGPLIDQESQERVLKAISRAEHEYTLAFKGSVPRAGFFVPPTIFRDVEPGSWLWQTELFAPVIACARAKDFSHALALANRSEYALTGGLFSRSPQNIASARAEFEVGNLYINRSCTGALVCRQPFGGFRMSGVGSKAGGPDYLLQFVEPRTITENTMRRGFSPDLV